MREVCNAEWDDIQDRLREKDAEIARLKALVKDRMYELEEINGLKSLLTRAADRLETSAGGLDQEYVRIFIAQLRKAVEVSDDPEQSAEFLLGRLANEQEANRKLRALLARAADALEYWMKDLASTEQQYVDAAMRDERLLSELRKAAG